MSDPVTLFGYWDVAATFYWVLRIAAALGGALLGWLLTGPLVQLLARLAFQQAPPKWLMPWSKAGGAVVVAALVYFFLPLGGPGGGGNGDGSGTGSGKGSAGKDGVVKDKNDVNKDKDIPGKLPANGNREPLEIELLGGHKFKNDGRYYLVQRKEPAQTLGEVEDLFKEKHARLVVHIVYSNTSVDPGHGAVEGLRELTRKFKIPLVEPPEEKLPNK